MTDPGAWLDAGLTGAPAGLRTAVQRATGGVRRGGEAPGAGTLLRERAEQLLAQAGNGPATRETALTLLAADALMTLACVWAAEHDPESLGALA